MSHVMTPPRPPVTPRPDLDERPPVDPRFRRRWAERRRHEGRRRLRVVVSLLVLVALAAGGFGLLHSPVFRVKNVSVVGSSHTPLPEVLAAAGLSGPDLTTLMVDAGPPRAVRAVEALPWVATASFRRQWPWTVVIKIKQRAPAALVISGGMVEEVDASGRVLAVVSPREIPPSLPVVTGAQSALPGKNVSPGAGLPRAALAELLAAAAAMPPALAQRKVGLSYSAATGLVARVGAGPALVLLGDTSDLATKLAVLEELANTVDLAGYSQVDLTVPERPALTPLPNSDNN